MKKPTIFLSHSHPDKKFVRSLAKKLEKDGVCVWLDEIEIKVGESIHQKVNEGLQKSDFFAIVLSKYSVSSKWVQDELSSASNIEKYKKEGVFILPVLIEECDVPPLLLDRRYANFKNDSESAYQELLDSISVHFKRNHPDVEVPEDESKTLGDILNEEILRNPNVLNELPPRLFEEFVAKLLNQLGYETVLTAATKDGGKDVIASRTSLPGIEPQRIAIQCKRYSQPVGVSMIQQLIGVKSLEGYDRGMLVTTSSFTKGAIEVAKRGNIDLVDSKALSEWLKSIPNVTNKKH